MALILFYDTETTGLPDFKAPSEAEHQPHIVQLAAALVDEETRKTVSSLDVIIMPEGWVISEEMTAIHGISQELALYAGVTIGRALQLFFGLWKGRKRVGFNESFDSRIIRIAQYKLGYSECQLEQWKNGKAECAMYGSRPYTQLSKNKLPKLTEAYRHFFGTDFNGAHNAMNDVNATISVYFAIQDEKAKELV